MSRTDNGVAFNYENYSKYVGEFSKNLSVYGRFLTTVNAKSFASWFAAGIIPGPFKTDCELLASTVDTLLLELFPNFWMK